jgi:putative nucleotidyltransferase with HDIG domain
MPSSQSPSLRSIAAAPTAADDGETPPREAGDASAELMRKRFVEALRRAEIVSLVNAAEDAAGLGRTVSEELSEAFDAEIALVAHRAPGAGEWQVVGTIGVPADEAARLAGEWPASGSGEAAIREAATRLTGIGPGSSVASTHEGLDGGLTLVCVVCLYETEFDQAERALLDAVTTSIGHALERFWAGEERDRLLREAHEASIATATALANALEARDDYTAGHAEVIAGLAVEVGAQLGLEGAELERVRWGAIFHDIGKIAIPDEILRKPGPLTSAEEALMQDHAIAGERILAPVGFLDDVRPLVRHSHERWDGNGYPDGLSGEEIPLGARIICVVDAWHAMVSERVYSESMSDEDAVAELERNAASQFDPEIVNTFIELRSSRRPHDWQPGHQ